MINNITSVRKYVEFPYISKSTYLSAVFGCPFRFKLRYLDGEEGGSSFAAISGTSLHHLFELFFDLIDYERLWQTEWMKDHDTPYNQVYNYFLSLIMNSVGEVENPHIIRNIKSFCRLHENHWFSLRAKYKSLKIVMQYFKPLDREAFVKNDKWMVFGTRDRTTKEEHKYLILDYKTGKIPKRAREVDASGIYASSMPQMKVVEGNFYSFLWLLEHGYDFTYDKLGKNKLPLWYCVKGNRRIKIDFLDYGFIYTNGTEAVVHRKKSNITSIRAILNRLPKIRNTDQPYNREPNVIRCTRCPYFLDRCKDVIGYEIYGNLLGSENAQTQNVQ